MAAASTAGMHPLEGKPGNLAPNLDAIVTKNR